MVSPCQTAVVILKKGVSPSGDLTIERQVITIKLLLLFSYCIVSQVIDGSEDIKDIKAIIGTEVSIKCVDIDDTVNIDNVTWLISANHTASSISNDSLILTIENVTYDLDHSKLSCIYNNVTYQFRLIIMDKQVTQLEYYNVTYNSISVRWKYNQQGIHFYLYLNGIKKDTTSDDTYTFVNLNSYMNYSICVSIQSGVKCDSDTVNIQTLSLVPTLKPELIITAYKRSIHIRVAQGQLRNLPASIIHYSITFKKKSSVYKINENSTISNLFPFTKYTITTHYLNSAKENGPVVSYNIETKPAAPGKPGLSVFLTELTRLTINLNYYTGMGINGIGERIIVQRHECNHNVSINSSISYSDKFIINDLEPDTCYYVKVIVVNNCCMSPATSMDVYTERSKPKAPFDLHVVNATAIRGRGSGDAVVLEVALNSTHRLQWYKNDSRSIEFNSNVKVSFLSRNSVDAVANSTIHIMHATPVNHYDLNFTLLGTYNVSVWFNISGQQQNIIGYRSRTLRFHVRDRIKRTVVVVTHTGSDLGSVVLVIIVFVVSISLFVTAVILFTRNRNCLKLKYQFISSNSRPPHEGEMECLSLPQAYIIDEIKSMESIAFIDHITKLHKDSNQGFSDEYNEINESTRDDLTCQHCNHRSNVLKNRYSNIKTYDNSRVILKDKFGKLTNNQTDYINANFIDGFRRPREYIATQGPLENTFEDFWKMIWQKNVNVIVMITNLTERGRIKCDQYWPSEGELQYGHYFVKLRSFNQTAHYVRREFSLKCGLKTRMNKMTRKLIPERTIMHYQYTDWPDHGTPDYTHPVLSFVHLVFEKADSMGTSPTVLHCSAGVGRTGTCIVIDAMLHQLKNDNTLNVKEFLMHIRNQRNNLVQTEDQYIFIHDALSDYLHCGDTDISANQLSNYCATLVQTDYEGGDNQHNISILTRLFTSMTYDTFDEYMTASATLIYNEKKNRPNSILPCDSSIVRLTAKPGIDGSDYINASYITGYRRNQEYVITQHPLPWTQDDFWRMVWDLNTQLIVLLHPVVQGFPTFWPAKEEIMDGGHFKVTHVESDDTTLSCGVIIKFSIQSTQDDYEGIIQMIIVNEVWPNTEFISQNFALIKEVNLKLKDHKYNEKPIIIVDRYGGSNAGQFCAIKSVYDELCVYPNDKVDPFMTMKLYHHKRPNIFKHEKEIFFVYKCLSVFVENKLLEVLPLLQTSPLTLRNSILSSEPASSC